MKTLPKNNFLDIYSTIAYVLSCIGVIASITYTLRHVRGSYHWFQISDQNASLFYLGSLMIAGAILFSIIHLVGPISFSISEIFWKFSGISRLPKNPWKVKSTLIIIGIWLFAIFVISTIFVSNSIYWLVASVLGSACFGALLIQGTAAGQVLNKEWLLKLWAIVTSSIGIFVTLISTITGIEDSFKEIIFDLSYLDILSGIFISLYLIINAIKKPIDGIKTTKSHSQKVFLINAISNISSPESYKYYGSDKKIFRRILVSYKPSLISLVSILDSYTNFLCILAISIPIGIFFAIAFGLPGAVTVAVVGSWAIATLYRWLIREWSSQLSLRAWMGGSYFKTALGYAIGPAAASWFYVLAMTMIFTLPLHGLVVSFIYGLIISLGDPNPPTHINYDLVITIADGIVVPIETAKIFMVNMGVLIFYIVSILSIPAIGLSLSLIFLAWRLKNHYNKLT